MAKCLSMMGEMSGSIGGCTWSRNKGGQYVRQRSVPTNPNSAAQQAIRTAFNNASTSWSADLTATQRAQWNTWAATNPVVDTLGQSIQLTGQQAYVKFATRLGNFLFAVPTTPPDSPAPASPDWTTTAVTWSPAGVVHVTFAPTPMPADLFLQVWASKPLLPGRDPNQRGAKLIGLTNDLQASPLVIASYPAAAGMEFNVWVNTMAASGQVSPAIKIRTVVA